MVSAKSWLQLGGVNVVGIWCGFAEKGGCEGGHGCMDQRGVPTCAEQRFVGRTLLQRHSHVSSVTGRISRHFWWHQTPFPHNIVRTARGADSEGCRLYIFSLASFCRRISALDCCTGQSPGKANEMTVALVCT